MEPRADAGMVTAMDKWIELVREKMREQGVTQDQLGERVGVSQGAVGHWLGRRRSTDLETMNRVLRELGMGNLEVAQVVRTAEQRAEYEATVDGLSQAGPHDRESLHLSTVYYCYPRLDWTFAGTAEPSRASYYRADGEVSSYESVGAAYWLRFEGDAMNSPAGMSVPDGTEVLVDPKLEALEGDLIVVRRAGTDQAILRQLAAENGDRYLKPLNPQYPAFLLTDECLIVGVAVQALHNLR